MCKIIQVKTRPNYHIWLEFGDTTTGELDLSYLAGKGVFALWNDLSCFEAVHITSSGHLAWSDEVELCADALYLKVTGKTLAEAFLHQ